MDKQNRVRSIQWHKGEAAPSMERWFSPEFKDRAPDTVARATEMLVSTDPEGYVAAVRDMDHRALLSAIQAPTLVIAGLLDSATPLGVHEFIRNNIAGAKPATALRFLLR